MWKLENNAHRGSKFCSKCFLINKFAFLCLCILYSSVMEVFWIHPYGKENKRTPTRVRKTSLSRINSPWRGKTHFCSCFKLSGWLFTCQDFLLGDIIDSWNRSLMHLPHFSSLFFFYHSFFNPFNLNAANSALTFHSTFDSLHSHLFWTLRVFLFRMDINYEWASSA